MRLGMATYMHTTHMMHPLPRISHAIGDDVPPTRKARNMEVGAQGSGGVEEAGLGGEGKGGDGVKGDRHDLDRVNVA